MNKRLFRFALTALALQMPMLVRCARGASLTTLYSFQNQPSHPVTPLMQGIDGNYYGTTTAGGAQGYGAVFRMTPAGEVSVLASFDSTKGREPRGGLIQASDGNFYGTTSAGGATGGGTVFKVTASGELTAIASLNGSAASRAGLVQGSDGNFYGTTTGGGLNYNGTVFKVTPAGALTTLVDFDGSNGSSPSADLVVGTDGNFYGTTTYGGANGYGTVFRATPSGGLTTLASFDSTTGRYPRGRLTEASDGNIYGTTEYGGTNSSGTVFRMTPAGALATLADFNNSVGSRPQGHLVQIEDALYGTTSSGGGIVFKVTLAGVLTAIVNSGAGTESPSAPYSGLFQGSDGDLYGTTYYGGGRGVGTVFKTSVAGVLTVLSEFKYTHGRISRGALVEGSDGNLYGTTAYGGESDYGTVFKINRDGSLTTLLSFDGSNGSIPSAGLIQGADGAFYGTTADGGAYGGGAGNGTVFRITNTGEFTTVASLTYSAGRFPFCPLVQGADGNFYGMATSGGANQYYGSVFKVTPLGAVTTLANFNSTNGRGSGNRLLQGTDGNFYGTTTNGGTYGTPYGGYGTAFKMTPTGTLTTLVNFDGSDGRSPNGGLVQSPDGNLYGTTTYGSSSGNFFRLTTGGALKSLARFGSANGSYPYGELIQDSDGNFYGTTSTGGAEGLGTIFKVAIGFGGPYTTDSDTVVLLHFDEAPGAVTTQNYGTIVNKTYAVQNTTSGNGSAAPPYATTILGAAGYPYLGNSASFTTAGTMIGFDANTPTGYQGDVNSSTLSTDRIAMSTLGIGNGGQSPFTIEALIYPSTIGANQQIVCTDSSASARGFKFQIKSTGQLEFNAIAAGVDALATIPTSGVHAFAANNWYHVAVTYDGVTIRLYWTRLDTDSEQMNLIGSTAGAIGTSQGAATGPLIIGNENRGSSTELFQGRIDEVRISKVARDANPTGVIKVLASFNAATGGNSNAGLVRGSDGGFYGITNSGGAGGGGTVFRLNFGAAVLAVTVSDLMASTATLNASVIPDGGSTSVHFEFGLTPALGSATPAQNIASGRDIVPVAANLTGLALQQTYYFKAVATNADGTVESPVLDFTTLSPIEVWRKTWFGSAANSGDGADDFDFESDGVFNIFEYLFNTDPRAFTPLASLPVVGMEEGFLTLTYRRRTGAEGITCTPVWSTSLDPSSWSSSDVTEEALPGSDDGTTTEFRAKVPMNGATRKYLRLQVRAPAVSETGSQ